MRPPIAASTQWRMQGGGHNRRSLKIRSTIFFLIQFCIRMLKNNRALDPCLMPTSHIQRSPAEFVDRPKVAIRQGVERIFRLKSTLSHFGRGSGGAPLNKSPAPVVHFVQVGRDTGGGRSSIEGTPCGSRAALPTFVRILKQQNGLKSSDCRPNIDRMFAEAPIDLRATCLRAPRPHKSPMENRWIKNRFRCPAIAGRSLKIAAGARSDRADTGRLPGENALFSSQRSRAGSVLDMWRNFGLRARNVRARTRSFALPPPPPPLNKNPVSAPATYYGCLLW